MWYKTSKIGEAGAVFGFGAWLTTRKKKSGPFSEKHEAGEMAELCDEFCKANDLKINDKMYPKLLKIPKD